MPGLNICLVLLVGKVRQGNLLPGCTSAAGDIVDCGIAVPRRRRVHLGDIVKSDTHLCLSELVVKVITASDRRHTCAVDRVASEPLEANAIGRTDRVASAAMLVPGMAWPVNAAGGIS